MGPVVALPEVVVGHAGVMSPVVVLPVVGPVVVLSGIVVGPVVVRSVGFGTGADVAVSDLGVEFVVGLSRDEGIVDEGESVDGRRDEELMPEVVDDLVGGVEGGEEEDASSLSMLYSSLLP